MGLILDSSVIVAKERQGHTVLQILEQLQVVFGKIDVALSVITIAELTHGAYRARTEASRRQRLAFVDRLCVEIPSHPLTIEIALLVGQIEGEQASHGFAIGFEDLCIGATALHLSYGVATLNVRHFERIPSLKVVRI